MRNSSMRTAKTLLTLFLALGALSAGAYALSWNGFTLVEWWRETHSGVVLSGAHTRARLVALTFDDGPDPHYTPRILKILRQYGIHATFFEEGRRVQAHPALASLVMRQGHVIGNHTYTHPFLNHQSSRMVHHEVMQCEVCLEKTLHVRSYLFRPPHGYWNPTIYREARREGAHIILWTVALEHHDAPTAHAMVARALRLVRPGGILLLHDGGPVSREATVRALPQLIEGLRKRGYRFVTVPELLRVRGDETFPQASHQRGPSHDAAIRRSL